MYNDQSVPTKDWNEGKFVSEKIELSKPNVIQTFALRSLKPFFHKLLRRWFGKKNCSGQVRVMVRATPHYIKTNSTTFYIS